MFCWSLFVLLYFFFWPLYYLFFFDIRILIAPLVSSNSSYPCPLLAILLRPIDLLAHDVFFYFFIIWLSLCWLYKYFILWKTCYLWITNFRGFRGSTKATNFMNIYIFIFNSTTPTISGFFISWYHQCITFYISANLRTHEMFFVNKPRTLGFTILDISQ